MEDSSIQRVSISGPTLASILQRISSSLGDVDGLLFGHVTHLTPTLSDDSSDSLPSSSQLIATVTSFLCPNSPLSFYDSLGRVNSPSLLRFLSFSHSHHFIGWFSGRRRTPLRPSMREFSVSRSLSSSSQFLFPVKFSDGDGSGNGDLTVTPCVFLLFSTPIQDQVIHTHEYRAYQFISKNLSFDAKPVDIVNIGPAFRGHYGNFTPINSGFPVLNLELSSGVMAMNEDGLSESKQDLKDQKEVDKYVEDYRVTNLSRLIGSEASSCTSRLENLYDKMLAKIDSLATQVEISNARVLEQENHNRKLRYRNS